MGTGNWFNWVEGAFGNARNGRCSRIRVQVMREGAGLVSRGSGAVLSSFRCGSGCRETGTACLIFAHLQAAYTCWAFRLGDMWSSSNHDTMLGVNK